MALARPLLLLPRGRPPGARARHRGSRPRHGPCPRPASSPAGGGQAPFLSGQGREPARTEPAAQGGTRGPGCQPKCQQRGAGKKDKTGFSGRHRGRSRHREGRAAGRVWLRGPGQRAWALLPVGDPEGSRCGMMGQPAAGFRRGRGWGWWLRFSSAGTGVALTKKQPNLHTGPPRGTREHTIFSRWWSGA